MNGSGKPLTGRKVLAIALTAFGVILAVNLTLAWQAVSTFPGLEVANGYVASQQFNVHRDAQVALGWKLRTDYADGRLSLAFTDRDGLPVEVSDLAVLVGRPTEARQDVMPHMTGRSGTYSAPLDLDGGRWLLRIEATAPDGTAFLQRRDFFVGG